MKASDVLALILIAAVVIDIVVLHLEIRRHRAYERATRPKLDPLVMELKCDNSEAMTKLAEVTAAAQLATEKLTKLADVSREVTAEMDAMTAAAAKAQAIAESHAG